MTPSTSILDLIPQRPPMVMIDELVYADGEKGRSCFRVKPDCLFVENDRLNASGLVENMAQTAAARMGFICRAENRPVPLGYIGAVQNLQILSLPKINELLETEISVKNQIFEVTILTGSVQAQGKTLARCELKIFISHQA